MANNTNKKKVISRRGKTVDRWNTAVGPKIVVRNTTEDPKKALTKKYFTKWKLGSGTRPKSTGYRTGGSF